MMDAEAMQSRARAEFALQRAFLAEDLAKRDDALTARYNQMLCRPKRFVPSTSNMFEALDDAE